MKKTDHLLKYKILAMIAVAVYFLQTFFISFGGIGADSLSYFGIAADLPHPETNLFPLGYPALLRLVYTFSKDYFWAYKILNLLFTAVIVLFSYYKKFYFRETVLILAGKTFYFTFFGAMSEGPFLFFMYFLLYFLHNLFTGTGNPYASAIGASVMMIFMFFSRYSGIYIYVSVLLYGSMMYFKIRDKACFRPLLLFAFLSGLGIGGYLLFNYIHFNSLTGEQVRGRPGDSSALFLIRNLLGLINAADPYIGIKPMSNGFGSLVFQWVLCIIDLFILRYMLRYYRRAKGTALYHFHILLWIMAGFYGAALLVSEWFQQIEEIGVRLMAASSFCLFFSFLILYFQHNISDRLIWRTGCFFFIFLVVYGLKDPGQYLKNKKAVEPQMAAFNHKKYLFNDERNRITVTTYYFPAIDRSFSYQHTNSQKGKLKESIAGTLNPKIKWIKEDTVKDKSSVLYTSQLRLN